jgi:hypothetical protein
MPLLDHFHPPLSPLHSWESFHNCWANAIADKFDRTLPSRFFAEVQVHVGSQVEADVAEFDTAPGGTGTGGGVVVQNWAPPAATQTLGIVLPDDIEVQVYDLRGGGKQLAGVIELVSPANKDRPETRRAFAAKCAAYLQRGIGVTVVDIVTGQNANLHDALMELLSQPQAVMAPGTGLYAAAYRPARRRDANLFDFWPVPLAVGQVLPVLGLALRGAFFARVDLEATYSEARQRCRL